MTTRGICTHLFMGTIIFIGYIATVQGAHTSKYDQLQSYISQLQNAPNDVDLRKRIIDLALSMKVPPAVSSGANQALGAGIYTFKNAQNQSDYQEAVKSFQEASLLAPWDASIYYNLSLAQEKTGQYDDATDSLRLYLLAAPHALDRDAVDQRIGMLDAEKKKHVDEEQSAIANAKNAANDVVRTLGSQHFDYGWVCSRNDYSYFSASSAVCSLADAAQYKNWHGGYISSPRKYLGGADPLSYVYFFKSNAPATVGLIEYLPQLPGTSAKLIGIMSAPGMENIKWCGGNGDDVDYDAFESDYAAESFASTDLNTGKVNYPSMLQALQNYIANLESRCHPAWVAIAADKSYLVISFDRPVRQDQYNPAANYHYWVIATHDISPNGIPELSN